jgi:hypothetical protein
MENFTERRKDAGLARVRVWALACGTEFGRSSLLGVFIGQSLSFCPKGIGDVHTTGVLVSAGVNGNSLPSEVLFNHVPFSQAR